MIEKLEEAKALLTQAIAEAVGQDGRLRLLTLTDEVVEVVWHSRDEIPPVGTIWASDGYGIWVLHSNGSPISKTATAVKYWTTALIPKPPLMTL